MTLKRNRDIRDDKPTRHHIIPRSRGGDKSVKNIAMVPHRKHDLYHQLFSNMTPKEIVDYLNKKFWNSNYLIEMRG